MARKKILLAYITSYSGHHKAASAIIEALNQLSGGEKLISKNLGKGVELIKLGNGNEVLCVDFLRYLHPIGRIIVEKSYLRMLKKNPQTWEYLYDNPEVYGRLQKWIDRLGVWKFPKLARLIEKFDPDIACCTQAFPALMLADFKQHSSLKMALTPIVGVFTDYAPHRYWVHPEINLYVVPSKEMGKVLVEKGISERRIRDFGIPIDPRFILNSPNKGDTLKKFGLNEFLPVVLVMGGSRGLGSIKEAIEELEKSFFSLQLVVVCGLNKKLQKKLEKITPALRCPVKIIGYTENIDELMKISSVIITKPGGLTVSECLACELPMILVNPIPGQEALNARFLAERDLAVIASDGKEAAAVVIRLLKNEQARQRMRFQARAFRRPDAALAIANALIKGWD
ncbi:MAG: glycosyltransferase [Patescibacteria group bacterium]